MSCRFACQRPSAGRSRLAARAYCPEGEFSRRIRILPCTIGEVKHLFEKNPRPTPIDTFHARTSPGTHFHLCAAPHPIASDSRVARPPARILAPSVCVYEDMDTHIDPNTTGLFNARYTAFLETVTHLSPRLHR